MTENEFNVIHDKICKSIYSDKYLNKSIRKEMGLDENFQEVILPITAIMTCEPHDLDRKPNLMFPLKSPLLTITLTLVNYELITSCAVNIKDEIVQKLFHENNEDDFSTRDFGKEWNKAVLEQYQNKTHCKYKSISNIFIKWFENHKYNITDIESLIDGKRSYSEDDYDYYEIEIDNYLCQLILYGRFQKKIHGAGVPLSPFSNNTTKGIQLYEDNFAKQQIATQLEHLSYLGIVRIDLEVFNLDVCSFKNGINSSSKQIVEEYIQMVKKLSHLKEISLSKTLKQGSPMDEEIKNLDDTIQKMEIWAYESKFQLPQQKEITNTSSDDSELVTPYNQKIKKEKPTNSTRKKPGPKPDPNRLENILLLQNKYDYLFDIRGYQKSTAIEMLKKDFPKWKGEGTIEKYLKIIISKKK
jgi:hypothetical protein